MRGEAPMAEVTVAVPWLMGVPWLMIVAGVVVVAAVVALIVYLMGSGKGDRRED
jgi:hypothetical protein